MLPQGAVLDAFMRSRARVSLIRGPLGSGKTFQCVQKALKVMCEQKPDANGVRKTRGYAIRNTFPDLFSTTIKDWMEIIGDLGHFTQGGKEPPTHRINFRLQDGTTVQSEAIFLALDREDHVKKLRGAQATYFWLNEVKELAKPIVDMADLRHGRYPSMMDGGPSWHGMFGDYNSPDEDHWLYAMAEEDRPDGWEFFVQPGGLIRTVGHGGQAIYSDNPAAENLANLPEGYYVRGRQGKSADWVDVNLCNLYGVVMDGKPVHPGYNDSIHCTGEYFDWSSNIPLILGVDFGRTPACAIIAKLPHRYVIIDEFCAESMSAAVFGPQLKLYLDATYPGATYAGGYGDPAGDHKGQATEETPILVLNAAGIPCTPCFSNEVVLRRGAIANPLARLAIDGKPALMVSPKARMIRKGLMGGFCYRRIKVAGDERYTDEPDKNRYSHPVEAAEYALMGAGEGAAALSTSTRKLIKPPPAKDWRL